MNQVTIRTKKSCINRVKKEADPNAYYIVYLDREPSFEISFQDKKTWIRPFGMPRSVPYSPIGDNKLTREEILDIAKYY